MLYCVTGASGSGKSACLSGLRQRFPEIDWHDFDDLPFTPSTVAERQIGTEYWMQVATANRREGRDTGIAGTVILGEILACPSAPDPLELRLALLDCHDIVRIDRIRRRDPGGLYASQEMLSWAAWQRMHVVDPQWRPDVIRGEGAPEMNWSTWRDWERGDARWHAEVIDTTHLTTAEAIDRLTQWISRERDNSYLTVSASVGLMAAHAGAV